MPAYIIVEIDILDPVGYEEYKKLAGSTVEKYGGKYIVRGGKTEVLEGDWKPKRIVVLQFESAERAKEWLNCEEYREPRKMRHRTARTNMILVEDVGCAGPAGRLGMQQAATSTDSGTRASDCTLIE